MPLVSILIPALRPDYLDLCIASALGQTCRDVEIIISDDSDGEDIEGIVSKWTDDRICYSRNRDKSSTSTNRDRLLALASGKYLKFIHDDDFLYPNTIERFVAIADSTGAALVFSWWHVIDQLGRPQLAIATGGRDELRLLKPNDVFEEVVAQSNNFIGGPSAVLVDSGAMHSLDNPFGVRDIELRFLTDVALFTNLAHAGHLVAGVGFFGSAYRKHAGQYSRLDGPAVSALVFEWELLLRWLVDCGHISPGRYFEAMALDKRQYLVYVAAYPELSAFIELAGRPGADGRFLSEEFLGIVDSAYQVIDGRVVKMLESLRSR